MSGSGNNNHQLVKADLQQESLQAMAVIHAELTASGLAMTSIEPEYGHIYVQ